MIYRNKDAMIGTRRKFLKSIAGAFATVQLVGSKPLFASAASKVGISDKYKSDFLVGAMVGDKFLFDSDHELQELVLREFNALTTDNIFKWENIHPTDKIWNWAQSDVFVEYAEKNGKYAVGHPLVWDSQIPEGLFSNRRSSKRTRQQYLEILVDHVSTLVGRYKGSIKAWDVVNESFDDDGGWINNNWYKSIGESYIENSFVAARTADPSATLIYNDYNLWKPSKRSRVVAMIGDFKSRGVPIDAIGMQGHIGLSYPDLKMFEESIIAFGKAGLKVHITELDVDVLPHPPEDGYPVYDQSMDPYRDGVPDDISIQLANRYQQIFEIFIRQKDIVDRVTLWGVSDRDSWRNDFPIAGRKNYPLLFDRDLNPKYAYDVIYQLK